MANSIDPDETAHYEPSHLDLHCLQRYWFWPAGLKELILILMNCMPIILKKRVLHYKYNHIQKLFQPVLR